MNPKFECPDPTFDVSKLAYDLSLIYAKSKLDEKLRTDPDYFYGKPASVTVEEAEFFLGKFQQAYWYYSGIQPADMERAMQDPKLD